MTPFQARLLAAERRYVVLDDRARKLKRGITALRQNIRDSDGLGGVLGCVRTWALTVVGESGSPGGFDLPLPGVTVGYGPAPFNTATQSAIGVTDSGGLLSAVTVDSGLSVGQFNIIGCPRIDPANSFAPSSTPCGASSSFTVDANTGGNTYGNYGGSNLITPWLIKNTLAVNVPALSIVGAVLTSTTAGVWTGSATASYPGGTIPGPASCSSASLPVNITMNCQYGFANSDIIFDYTRTGGGGAQRNCPNPSGAASGSASWGNSGGGSVLVTGDGNLAAGLTIIFTPPGGSSSALFPSGNPTVILSEV